MAFCWKFCGNMKVLFGLLLLLFILTETKQSCNYSGNLEIDKTYHVNNPNYPNKTKGEANCRWQIMNYVEINCDVDLPTNTKGCEQQGLSIQFEGKETPPYCGNGTITIEGINPIIIFFSSRYSKPGKFGCTIQAKKVHGNCSCGKKKPTRIVGGNETGINEYPMMAGIINVKNREIYCGATIICPTYVVTAAHCLNNRILKDIAVVVGEHDVSTGTDTNATKLFPVTKIIRRGAEDAEDIALCKIHGVIKYSAEVGPVCLPFQHSCDSFGGAIVTALGWGLVGFSDSKPYALRKVELNVISHEECKKAYSNDDKITREIICTFTPGKDTCQMDSGGPLLWKDSTTHRFTLIGIIFKGMGCASAIPALNVRVGAHINWIKSHTDGCQFCGIE